MNILVLGASSAVGAGVAESFSHGNRLLLTGRDAFRLERTAGQCRTAGACEVVTQVGDLGQGAEKLMETAVQWRPDVIVNAASTTSRLGDDAAAVEDLERIVAVDLTAPLELIRRILSDRNGGGPLGVIYISSFLSVASSPDRAVYGSLKRIHERVLLRLAASRPWMRLMIVRVSKRIPVDEGSQDAARLGVAVRKGYRDGKRMMYHGISGRIGIALHHVHPFLFSLGVKLNRFFR